MNNKCGYILPNRTKETIKMVSTQWVMLCALLVLFGLPVHSQAQGTDTTFQGDKRSMAYLRFLFQHDKDVGIPYDYLAKPYKNRLPGYLVKKFLPHEPVSNPEKGFYSGEVLVANNQYLAFAYEKPCLKGELCRTRYLTILDHQGHQQGHTVLGYDSITRLQMDTMRGHIIQQRLVEKVRTNVQYTFKETGLKKRKSVDRYYHYLRLTDEGELVPLTNLENSPDRQYPWTAKRLVQPAELDEFTTRELNILKNEIFADYQFRFPSERWREYFKQKAWYEPRYDNVTDSLNIIERFNIKRVIRFQRNDS